MFCEGKTGLFARNAKLPSELGSGESCSVVTSPGAMTNVPEVMTSGLPEPAKACPSASIAAQSRCVILAGSAKSPPKAMWMTPSATWAALPRASRSSSEPRRTPAPSSSRRAADLSDRARPVTVWPAEISSATIAGPVSPEPPVTKRCTLVSPGSKTLGLRYRRQVQGFLSRCSCTAA